MASKPRTYDKKANYRYQLPTNPEVLAQTRLILDYIAKDPVVDHDGWLNVGASLRRLQARTGIQPKNWPIPAFLHYFPEEYPALKLNPFQRMGGGHAGIKGLRMGPNAKQLPFGELQKPWVYEVVCEPTGRRYIGLSVRPDLRRAVHYYFLNNPTSTKGSNNYRKSKEAQEDIAKYGPDAFYFDVLERVEGPMPTRARGKYHTEPELKWMNHYGQEKVYNRIVPLTRAEKGPTPHQQAALDYKADKDAAREEMKRAKADKDALVKARMELSKICRGVENRLLAEGLRGKEFETAYLAEVGEENAARLKLLQEVRDAKEHHAAVRDYFLSIRRENYGS